MLLDPATAARHRQAAGALRALGIAVAGLFSVRPDLGEEDLERLREHVRELGIVMPIAHAPARRRGEARGAPGSALPAQLIQADLPRGIAAWPGRERAAWDLLRRRPGLVWSALPGAARALGRSWPFGSAATGAAAPSRWKGVGQGSIAS